MNTKDTTPEMAEQYRQLLMARPGEERVRMGCDMLDTAIEMFFATLPPGLPERERRARLFVHLYGREFTGERRERILHRIQKGPSTPTES
jgi:hypothetical protein